MIRKRFKNQEKLIKNKTKLIKKGLCLGLSFIFLLGTIPALAAQPLTSRIQGISVGNIVPISSGESTQVNSNIINNEGQAQEGLTSHLIVKLSSGTSPEDIAQNVQAVLARKGPLQFITLAVEPKRVSEVTAKLKEMPGVLSVNPSQTMKLTASQTAASATDPHYSEQWGLNKIEAPKAWDLGATGKGITVAVVDTGVDLNHPDLRDNVVSGYNAITGSEGFTVTQDNNGHGTHVAGIIAAEMNSTGIVGVAYQAKIMPIKAMNRFGEGTDDAIADGIIWAADNGAKIINLSLGSDTQEQILKEAVQYANNKGCLVVAAGGNKDEGNNYTTITYPAADPQVLAVTATDSSDRLASFSLTGPNAGLAGPGTNIVSDYWDNGSGYATSDGTSMAAPFVSGAAALVWSAHPDFSAQEIRKTLEDSALDLGSSGRDNSYGYGRVDAYWAVKFAAQPSNLSAITSVTWEGGILQGGTAKTPVSLSIPSRAFGSDPSKSINVGLSSSSGDASLPDGVTPVGDSIKVSWDGGTSVQKLLQLAITPSFGATDDLHLLYIYRWSGTRWLKVGGGVNSGTVSAGITEPGIYRVGSAGVPTVTRLAGEDRLDTAIQISQAGFPEGADTVILARAEDFPDALAGAPLAYKYHAPILLTNQSDLPANVLSEIQRLNPQKVVLLGGTGAISSDIETELSGSYSVTRLGGANRYATAQQIAAALGMTGEAVIVNGDNYPDAISMASIAAQYGVPIFLTSKDSLPYETDQGLRQLNVSGTIAVGGDGVIAPNNFAAFPSSVRLSGQDRYGTAAEVLQAFKPEGEMVFLATGDNFPDALTGGVLAAINSTDLVLVPPAELNEQEKNVLQGWGQRSVYAFGGSGVVSDSLLSQIQALLNL